MVSWGINQSQPDIFLNSTERGSGEMCQCPQCGEDGIYYFDDGGFKDFFVRTWDCPNCGYREEVIMEKGSVEVCG
jgi:predicted RNA-binding Zn-ribbon protein involved in translation (DUF1610 family)